MCLHLLVGTTVKMFNKNVINGIICKRENTVVQYRKANFST
jgi:hypothetical protein